MSDYTLEASSAAYLRSFSLGRLNGIQRAAPDSPYCCRFPATGGVERMVVNLLHGFRRTRADRSTC